MNSRLKKLSFLLAVSLIFSITAQALSENTRIGVFPFTNQRVNSTTNWIGYFIQAKIEKHLRYSQKGTFPGLRTLLIWKNSLDLFSSETHFNNIVTISGSYQRVVDIGVIDIVATSRLDGKFDEKRIRVSFDNENLSEKLYEACLKIDEWIDSSSKVTRPFEPDLLNRETIRDFYTLVAQVYDTGGFPESRSAVRLMERINENSPAELIAGFSEAMLILSSRLNHQERESLYAQVEALLKKAIQRHRANAELYALLAETYLLNQSYVDWVEKTAKDALTRDNQNDLALIILLIIAEPNNAEAKGYDDLLEQTNPVFWRVVARSPALYQKELLKDDLLRTGRRLGKF